MTTLQIWKTRRETIRKPFNTCNIKQHYKDSIYSDEKKLKQYRDRKHAMKLPRRILPYRHWNSNDRFKA